MRLSAPGRMIFLLLGLFAWAGQGRAEPWDDNRIADELGASRAGLNEFTFRRMTPDQLGWMDMNPYALFDLGYIDRLDADLSGMSQILTPSLLSTWGQGEAVRTYFRGREGRAKPLAPRYMRTYHSNDLTVTRLIQKGGFPTGNAGGHKDGLLDLSEAYGDMIWGELLHQLGGLSTRGLLAARQRGVRRNMEGGAGLDAGVMVRFGELPRLREPGGWHDNYQDMMLNTVRFQSPILISGLESLDPKQLNWFLALHNEAFLKDQWILHGSYTFDENRSAALIDFGTLSGLYEPNPAASLGYTSYAQEMEESANKAVERMGDHGRDVPAALRTVEVRGKLLFNNVFWSSYAFFQLRRLGLSDEQILTQFTRERVSGTQFQFYLASDRALEFAKAITEIDKQTLHSPEAFSVDWQDGKSVRTEQRVVVNTRKLLRALLDTQAYRHSPPTDAELRSLLAKSFFGTHGGNKGPEHILNLLDQDPGKRDYLMKKVREIVSFTHDNLSPILDGDISAVRNRASFYPTEQTLPHRREVSDLAWRWANDPGSFGREFVPWIEARVPHRGPVADRRAAHLANRGPIPREAPRDFFSNLLNCHSKYRALKSPAS